MFAKKLQEKMVIKPGFLEQYYQLCNVSHLTNRKKITTQKKINLKMRNIMNNDIFISTFMF